MPPLQSPPLDHHQQQQQQEIHQSHQLHHHHHHHHHHQEMTPNKNQNPPLPYQPALVAVVSHICRSVGFQSAKTDALDLASELLSIYMLDLFAEVKTLAETANRLEPNIGDAALVFRNRGISPLALKLHLEDSAASDTSLPPIVLDGTAPVNSIAEEFKIKELVCEDSAHPRPSFLPDHFPNFPCIHTFKSTEISGLAEEDPAKLREIRMTRARAVEANLRRIMLARERELGSKAGVVNYLLQKRRVNKSKGGLRSGTRRSNTLIEDISIT